MYFTVSYLLSFHFIWGHDKNLLCIDIETNTRSPLHIPIYFFSRVWTIFCDRSINSWMPPPSHLAIPADDIFYLFIFIRFVSGWSGWVWGFTKYLPTGWGLLIKEDWVGWGLWFVVGQNGSCWFVNPVVVNFCLGAHGGKGSDTHRAAVTGMIA